MKIEYRKGNTGDLKEICTLIKGAIVNLERHNIFQWDNLYPDEKILREDIIKKELNVGIISGRIASIYVLNQESDDDYINGRWEYADLPYCVIHRLCVNPDFQNMGVAGRTMKHIEAEVLKMGIKSIRLDAFTENPFALKLYHSLGYRITGYADWRKGRFCLMEKYLELPEPA